MDLRIGIDVSELKAMAAIAASNSFRQVSDAVRIIVETGESRWKRAVLASPLWSGEREAYAASIRSGMTTPFSGFVESDYKYVEDIETGRPPYDMKRMLDTSLKVRVSKKGRRYLIIPFRHNTPGHTGLARAMPKEVYESAKELSPSRITGHGSRLSGTGAWDVKTQKPARVRTRKYLWGGRLGAEPEYKLKPSHKSDPYAGMVRFPNSTGSSSYMTFRVMSEGSSGWILPAKPGLFIARAVADSMQRDFNLTIPAAMAADISAA